MLTKKTFWFSLMLYGVFALLCLMIMPFIGAEPIAIDTLLSDISEPREAWSIDMRIFYYQRLPRVILGFLVGGALAVTGCVFQVMLRNPLAAPSTLGITAGGALGAVLIISVPSLSIIWGPIGTLQIAAFVGSLLIVLLIYAMARRRHSLSIHTLLLAGVTLGIVCSALCLLIRYLAHPDLLVAMDRWTMGGLETTGYRDLALLLPLLLPGLGLLLRQMDKLNHLSMGEEMAYGYGLDVRRLQKICFFAGSMATAAVVSTAGPIFFVGLIVPHIVRQISGYDHRIVLPGAFLTGGGFLVLCDTFARTLIAPTELPVGIITAILGGPFFIYLLMRKI